MYLVTTESGLKGYIYTHNLYAIFIHIYTTWIWSPNFPDNGVFGISRLYSKGIISGLYAIFLRGLLGGMYKELLR